MRFEEVCPGDGLQPAGGLNHGLRLNAADAEQLLDVPAREGLRPGARGVGTQPVELAPNPATLIGKRDRAIPALLVVCGLRRAEIVNLDLGNLQQRDARWAIRICSARAAAPAP